MPTSQASAVWEGKLKDGKGTFTAGSGAFKGPYSFATRFEGKPGTNPEELIAAAHAACFSMALSAGLEKAGKPAARAQGNRPDHARRPAGIAGDRGSSVDRLHAPLSRRLTVYRHHQQSPAAPAATR